MDRAPIELHINWKRDGNETSPAYAHGTLIVDDGVSLDTKDRLNWYEFDFLSNTTVMELSITQVKLATKDTDPAICTHCINMNDRMKTFIIYNTEELMFFEDWRSLTNGTFFLRDGS